MGVHVLAIRRASRKGRGSATPGGGTSEPRPQRTVDKCIGPRREGETRLQATVR